MLFWLSARGGCPVKSFLRHAANYLDPLSPGEIRKQAYRHARVLVASGHAERGAGRIEVCPSLVVAYPTEGAFLCYGSRSQRDRKLLADLGLETREGARSPEIWSLTGPTRVPLAAARLGARVVEDRSLELLTSLPSVAQALRALPTVDPPDGALERWSGRGFEKTQQSDVPGLYREKRAARPRWLHRDGEGVRELADPEQRALALASTVRASYESESGLLSVKPWVLPTVLERALRMASREGLREEGGALLVENLAPAAAREVLRILDSE